MLSMKDEARVIERILVQHGVQGRVLPPPASYQTASLRLYRIGRGPGVAVARVVALADELDEALTVVRRRPVRCRFDRLPLRLEVPRPDPQMTTLATALAGLPSGHAVTSGRLLALAGEGHSGGRGEALLLDLAHPNSPHVLLAGTTGSGKSTLLAGLLLSLAHLHSPQEAALVVLDPKGVDLGGLAALPHLAAPVLVDADDVVTALRSVVAELERRKRALSSDSFSTPESLPRLVVAIDEMADLMEVAGKEVERSIRRILQVGRGLGIHVIGATQKPLASVIGSLVKANFPARLVGKVASSEDAKVAAGLPDTDAQRLPGLGAFLLVAGSEVRRIQSYPLPVDGVGEQAQRVRRRWQGEAAAWQLPSPPAAEPVAIPAPDSPGETPAWLQAAVARYRQEHGKLPSQRAVQRVYQGKTGQMLAWESIRRLLQSAP
jgi:S-DNA-T family DNA segregation ATPase FtsK/SpoIIIE